MVFVTNNIYLESSDVTMLAVREAYPEIFLSSVSIVFNKLKIVPNGSSSGTNKRLFVLFRDGHCFVLKTTDRLSNFSTKQMHDLSPENLLIWLRSSAGSGNCVSQCLLGDILFRLGGTTLDQESAISLWKQSADSGHLPSILFLSEAYSSGNGVDRNVPLALYWYTRAAEAGEPKSQFRLFSMYSTGTEVDIDNKKALYWLDLSAGQQYEEALTIRLALSMFISETKTTTIVTSSAESAPTLLPPATANGIFSGSTSTFSSVSTTLSTSPYVRDCKRRSALKSTRNRFFLLDDNDDEKTLINPSLVSVYDSPPLLASPTMIVPEPSKSSSSTPSNSLAVSLSSSSNNKHHPKAIIAQKAAGMKSEEEKEDQLLSSAISESTKEKAAIAQKSAFAAEIKLSAARRSSAVEFNLGNSYFYGINGADVDLFKAVTHGRLASFGEHAVARYNLGMHYLGEVHRNDSEAIFFMRLAANSGHEEAMYQMGLININGNTSVSIYRDSAISWWSKAFESNNHVLSALHLGFCFYTTGSMSADNMSVDMVSSFNWFLTAAKLGEADAQHCLSRAYFLGHGVEINFIEGMKWMTLSANNGNADSQYNLGFEYLYSESKIVKIDSGKGFSMLEKAAKQGHVKAQVHLGLCHRDGDSTHVDLKVAFEWFSLAAKNGDAGAQFTIGSAFELGEGTLVDLTRAEIWYNRAAVGGDERANDYFVDKFLKVNSKRLIEVEAKTVANANEDEEMGSLRAKEAQAAEVIEVERQRVATEALAMTREKQCLASEALENEKRRILQDAVEAERCLNEARGAVLKDERVRLVNTAEEAIIAQATVKDQLKHEGKEKEEALLAPKRAQEDAAEEYDAPAVVKLESDAIALEKPETVEEIIDF